MHGAFILITHVRVQKKRKLLTISFSWIFQVFPPASHFALQHNASLGLHILEFAFIFCFKNHPPHQQTHALVSFVPPAFIPCFIFTSCLPPSFILIPFNARCSSVVLLYRALLHGKLLRNLTPRYRHPKWNQAELPSWVHVPLPSPGSTWPYCRRATDGLLAQNGSAADTKSLSRSRCLLPLDICPWDGAGWMGNGGEGREY